MTHRSDAVKEEKRRASMARLTLALEADLITRKDEWDQPPGLFFLYDTGDDGWQLSEMSQQNWSPSPVEALLRISQGAQAAITHEGREIVKRLGLSEMMSSRPKEWQGMAFFCEAWMVMQHKVSEDDGPDSVLMEMASARMLSQHPARIESKCFWVALQSGAFAMSSLSRGGGSPETMLAYPGTKLHSSLMGTIPEALISLVSALSQM